MYFCFVNESGGFEAPGSNVSATPLMTLVGLIIDSTALPAITEELIRAKMRFFPQKCHSPRFLDRIRHEIKGSEIRASLRSPRRKVRRQAMGYLDRILQILAQH